MVNEAQYILISALLIDIPVHAHRFTYNNNSSSLNIQLKVNIYSTTCIALKYRKYSEIRITIFGDNCL